MNLISLFDLIFVSFANCYTLFDIFNFLSSFLLKIFVLYLNAANSFLYLIDFVAFKLFCVFVNALHAHDLSFLLAVEHKILLMNVALGCETVFCGRVASWVFVISLGVITGLAASFVDIWCLALGPDVGESLGVCHLFEFALCIFWFLWVIRDCLAKRTFV